MLKLCWEKITFGAFTYNPLIHCFRGKSCKLDNLEKFGFDVDPEIAKEFAGLEIIHITVMNWVTAYMDRINEYVKQFHLQVSNTWHADEQNK